METALDASNRGFRLLQKMGWKQGTGLGKHEQGNKHNWRSVVWTCERRSLMTCACMYLCCSYPAGIVEPVKMKENLVCLGLGKAVSRA